MNGRKARERGRERKVGSTYILARENASLIKSILGNRRCMNNGELVRGVPPSEKIRAYRRSGGRNGAVITARSDVEVARYFTGKRFAVTPSVTLDLAIKTSGFFNGRASPLLFLSKRKQEEVMAICAEERYCCCLNPRRRHKCCSFHPSLHPSRVCPCTRASREAAHARRAQGQSARDR